LSSLKESFESHYETLKSSDRRNDFKSLSRKEQLLYELEELAETETSVWEKDRIRLSKEDLESLVSGLVEQMDVEPVYLDQDLSRNKDM
jgi:hypothetical protein